MLLLSRFKCKLSPHILSSLQMQSQHYSFIHLTHSLDLVSQQYKTTLSNPESGSFLYHIYLDHDSIRERTHITKTLRLFLSLSGGNILTYACETYIKLRLFDCWLYVIKRRDGSKWQVYRNSQMLLKIYIIEYEENNGRIICAKFHWFTSWYLIMSFCYTYSTLIIKNSVALLFSFSDVYTKTK